MQSTTLFFTLSCLGTAGLTLAAVPPANADPFLPVPPASFLNYHVGSADQLVQEITLDEVVRARLARHFHQSEPKVSSYVRNNLVLTHLSKPGLYQVACVSPSGREYSVAEHLAAGTGVFALKSTGQPILKQACGNPLVAVLPVVAEKKPPQLAPIVKTAPAQSTVSAAMPSDVVFTAMPPLEVAQTGAIGPFVKVAGITQALGHGGGGLFPAVLGVAGLGLFGGHHGPPSSVITPNTPPIQTPPVVTPPIETPPVIPPVTPPVFTPPVTPPVFTPPVTPPVFIGSPPVPPPSQTAVPEPGPLVALGIGAGTLGLLGIRARRRRLVS